MNRREVISAGGAAALAGLLPGATAAAAPQPAAPSDDDLGFLAFGAVAEGVLARFYTAALAVRGAWSIEERGLLGQAHARQRKNVDRINAVLGPDDAVSLDDFSRTVKVGSRAGALKVGRGLESLVLGVYLNGVGYAVDPGTRLLLGRLIGVASGQQAVLTRLAHLDLGGLPKPIDLEAAGRKLDLYLKDPSS